MRALSLALAAALLIGTVIRNLTELIRPAPSAHQEREQARRARLSGLRNLVITNLRPGDERAASAKRGDVATIAYTAWRENGTEILSTRATGPFRLEIGATRVIEGLERGVLGMHPGGRRRIEIPPELAYGSRGLGTLVPPNARLRYEIDLLELASSKLGADTETASFLYERFRP